MTIQHLGSTPKAADFTPLQEHQEQTPSTFFGSKPVLYAQYAGLTLSVLSSQLKENAAFASLATSATEDTEISTIEHIDIYGSTQSTRRIPFVS